MTDLRTAAQHALEALEADCGGRCNAEYNPCWQREVAETLRAALAEPVQEPTPMPPFPPVSLWERGCAVCGIGAGGHAYGHACQRSDCPTRVTCGGAA